MFPSVLNPPPDTKTAELTNSIIWMGDDGFLYSKAASHEFVQATREQMEADMAKFLDITGGKKARVIAELHPGAESPAREDRDFIAEKLAAVTLAMAIVTPNALSRMIANLFFKLRPAKFPMKMFVSVSDARRWINEIA